METLVLKSGGWLAVVLIAVVAIAASADFGFSVHIGIVAAAALLAMAATLGKADYFDLSTGAAKPALNQSIYDDEPIRWGVVATLFWGVAGFAAGLR
jgi:cytochrome c oxidase cbb3-type subunit 1